MPKAISVARCDANIGPEELFAALSYMTDTTPNGTNYHTWRVALVAQRVARDIAPAARQAVFWAGLLQDLGTVGARAHISEYASHEAQMADAQIRTHPERGGALLELLPGMAESALYVRLHHERWDGSGYPSCTRRNQIPIGAQILRAADEAAICGCYSNVWRLKQQLQSLASLTGIVWSREVWSAFVKSMADAQFYAALVDAEQLPALLTTTMDEVGTPESIRSDAGIERVFHIFAALTDAKDPSKTGHALRVARVARTIAQKQKMHPDDVTTVYRVGLAHDCGLAVVPQSITGHLGRFTKQELETIRRHAQASEQILRCIPDRPGMECLATIVGQHHEWLDGRGYPRRMIGKDIHPVAKTVSVADAFDSMTSVSNYRVLSVKGALARLADAAGTQFAPEPVEALRCLVEAGELDEEMPAAA